MSDELRAAAERLLGFDGYYEMQASDGKNLARAYLAEHPADDDEPVTADWLRSVGFKQDADTEYTSDDLILAPEDDQVALHWMQEGIEPDEIRTIWIVAENEGIYTSASTRGALRRLAAALGVTLKGTTDGT